MPILTIQLDSQIPINDQIVSGLRRAIATGELAPEDELPPVRQLAADLGVNLNTVARAYRVLEASGLVSAVRGRGTRIRSSTEKENTGAPTNITRLLSDVIADAKLAGMTRATIKQVFGDVLETFFNDMQQRQGDGQ